MPPVDDNARKVALNLALAEFEAVQKENDNFSQGSSFWARLTNRPHMKRRDPMNKKYIYGGMATAMVIVLAAGVTLQNNPLNIQSERSISSTSGAGSLIREVPVDT